MRYAYHDDAEVFAIFDVAHAQGQYPNRFRSGLRIGGPRWAALLRQWCQKNGVVYREFRTGPTRCKRSRAPGRIDLTKPAFIAAGLAPARPPVLEQPGAPRTPEQIAAFERSKQTATIAKAIQDYRRSNWRRDLKPGRTVKGVMQTYSRKKKYQDRHPNAVGVDLNGKPVPYMPQSERLRHRIKGVTAANSFTDPVVVWADPKRGGNKI